MFKSFKGLCYPSVNKRLNSSKATSLKVKNTKAYQHTVFLPKTNFPSYVKPSEIPERDHRILMVCSDLKYLINKVIPLSEIIFI